MINQELEVVLISLPRAIPRQMLAPSTNPMKTLFPLSAFRVGQEETSGDIIK